MTLAAWLNQLPTKQRALIVYGLLFLLGVLVTLAGFAISTGIDPQYTLSNVDPRLLPF